MERNYDEVIADMLIQLDQIDRRMKKAEERMEIFDEKLIKSNKRMDLTIKRMVLEDKRMEKIATESEKRNQIATTKFSDRLEKLQIESEKRSQLATEKLSERLEGLADKIDKSNMEQAKVHERLMKRMEQSEKLLINAIVKNKLIV